MKELQTAYADADEVLKHAARKIQFYCHLFERVEGDSVAAQVALRRLREARRAVEEAVLWFHADEVLP